MIGLRSGTTDVTVTLSGVEGVSDMGFSIVSGEEHVTFRGSIQQRREVEYLSLPDDLLSSSTLYLYPGDFSVFDGRQVRLVTIGGTEFTPLTQPAVKRRSPRTSYAVMQIRKTNG